ncbi:MAG: DUF2071 domain-containing protein, partial [Bacteroidetes bacterium]|nr:DUF2071 domain-containing protein [Bacteroidota bacterium]
PYQLANISRENEDFYLTNKTKNRNLILKYKVGNQMHFKSPLDNWLTERYALFYDVDTQINLYEIHHLPWTLNLASIKFLEVNYPEFSNLFENGPVKTFYSKGVQSLVWKNPV